MRYVNLFDEYLLNEVKKHTNQEERVDLQDEDYTPAEKELLLKIEKKYPMGSKYKSITSGETCKVETHPYFVKYRGDIEKRRVSVRFGKGLIYDNGNWAEKVE